MIRRVRIFPYALLILAVALGVARSAALATPPVAPAAAERSSSGEQLVALEARDGSVDTRFAQPASGHVYVSVAKPSGCGVGQTRAVIAGRHTCLFVGRRCKTAQDSLYHRYGYHCVSGRLARHHPPAPAEHTIGVRDVNGIGELYNRATGTKFVPRGSNYIRLAPQENTSGGVQVYHSTFNVGRYDSAQAEAALTRMAADGYNVVRVFLSQICVEACTGDPATRSLRTAYIANVVDFLRRAKNHGIFVLLTSEWLPPNTTYADDLASARGDWFNDINLLMLSPQGVVAQQHFWTDFVKELVRQKAPTDAIFAYELWNEAFVVSDQPPFSLTSGRVETANGRTYDMANASDHKRMIDDGFVFLIDQVREAIRKVDPTALVTMGFFHDTEPNPSRAGDNRLVRTRAVIEHSTADFIDIHPYPGTELTFPQLMQNYGIDGPTAKPIIMGEFGAFKFAYSSANEAANELVSWQRQSCAYGIDGWLLWTWDSAEQPELWNGLDAGGTIERALSPASRPDPCA
jgi:Cellulase (glycosyl hydrolase family 5)